MATSRFFEKFPVVDYDGTPALNLMRRVNLTSAARNYYSQFYTYTLDSNDRMDNVAFNYYDDPDMDWLIYLANDVVDPYYDVSLSENDFLAYIEKEYGSVETALQQIEYWRNNWRGDDSIISSEQYNALPNAERKYWAPTYSAFGIAGYKRSEDDIILTTNRIVSFDLGASVETAPTPGDILIKDTNSSVYGTVAWANTSAVTVQHIYGDWEAGSDYTVTIRGTSTSLTVDAESVTETNVIPASEEKYFSSVSTFDKETEENERKREIYLIDAANAKRLNKQLNDIMK